MLATWHNIKQTRRLGYCKPIPGNDTGCMDADRGRLVLGTPPETSATYSGTPGFVRLTGEEGAGPGSAAVSVRRCPAAGVQERFRLCLREVSTVPGDSATGKVLRVAQVGRQRLQARTEAHRAGQ